jgi:hypothetical protein
VEAGADFRPAGDSCTLAQGWIQVVLGVAFAASNSAGRKCVSIELHELTFRMVAENPTWGAPRIHGELRMLGFDISERTMPTLTFGVLYCLFVIAHESAQNSGLQRHQTPD